MAQQPNEGGDKLANPFGSPPSSSHGFIAFSSSTPVGGSPAGANAQGSHFKPRRGKGNRRGNWERFGAAQDQSPQMNGSPHMGFGRPRHAPNQGSWRGRDHHTFSPHEGDNGNRQFGNYSGRGGPFFHSGPREPRGPRGPRGGHKSRSFNTSGGEASYFHPSMLEDPWARFENVSQNVGGSSSLSTSETDPKTLIMSDSMIPQVGDSFFQRNLNPAPEVNNDDTNETKDDIDMSASSSVISVPENHDENHAQMSLDSSSISGLLDLKKPKEEGGKSLSDSMIPLVGDSMLVSQDDHEAKKGDAEDDEEKREDKVTADLQ